MAKKSSALAGIFDDPETEVAPPPVPQAATEAIAPSTPAAAPSSKPTRAEAVPKQRGRGGQGARSDPGESPARRSRSEEHTSELQSLMRISYAVFCLKKKIT